MDAEVDVSNQDGKTLADAPRDAAQAHTQAFAAQDDAANEDVQPRDCRECRQGRQGRQERPVAKPMPWRRPLRSAARWRRPLPH